MNSCVRSTLIDEPVYVFEIQFVLCRCKFDPRLTRARYVTWLMIVKIDLGSFMNFLSKPLLLIVFTVAK